RRDVDALPDQPVDFSDQRMRVEHHAIADDRKLAGANDARGKQRKLVGLAVDDERMAGIVSALKANHYVGLLREPVDDLAFSFVAPLRADDHYIRHRIAPKTKRHTKQTPARERPGCA